MQRSELEALRRGHLQALASRPNTTVLDVTHDHVNTAWTASRVRRVITVVAEHMATCPREMCDFDLRKSCIRLSSETQAFQRQHPQLFWTITDREIMAKPNSKLALEAMLKLRDDVDMGVLTDENEANAMATREVMNALHADSTSVSGTTQE